MNALVFVRPLALAVVLAVPAGLTAQPPDAPPSETPPHLIRLEGDSAQATRDGVSTPLEQGDPIFFGDRLDLGESYGQVLWGDGSRIALDRGTRLDALSAELLALTAGRTLVSRPAAAASPLRLDTPAASLVLAPDGEYRVSLDGDVTSLAVTRGHVDVQTGMGSQLVNAGYQVALRDGIAPETPRRFNAAGYDSFIAWANAAAAVPAPGAPLDTFQDPQFEAYSDVFNRYGAWQTDPTYGAVWYPTVGADWRPYTAGYWHAYGPGNQWLWVGRDPFGWPTHHYGRWGMNNGGRWFWMPGRQWAPSWVSWSVGPGYIGWSPLGDHDRPVRAWDTVSQPRGGYPGGTLDASRAWTVVPSDRFGQRGAMSAYAVDPRTLANLSAFVSQRVGPPARYGYPAGGAARPYGAGGTAVYGPGGYYGGVRSRSGGDTNIRGGVGPTRVGPPAPGYGGPTPPPEDPYERAQRAVVPRSRQRQAQPDAAPPSRAPARTDDAAAPAPPAARQRTPPRETPPTALLHAFWSSGGRDRPSGSSRSGSTARSVAYSRAGSRWYSRVPSVFQASISSETSFTIRAGLPTTTLRSGTCISAGTKQSAPTMHPAPMMALSMMTAFMPTSTFAPMRAPCTMAPWPMCAPSSSTTVTPGNMWTVQFSWTLHPSAISIAPQSPRNAAPGPTYTSRPMTTLPVTVAAGCTKADSCTTGTTSSNA